MGAGRLLCRWLDSSDAMLTRLLCECDRRRGVLVAFVGLFVCLYLIFTYEHMAWCIMISAIQLFVFRELVNLRYVFVWERVAVVLIMIFFSFPVRLHFLLVSLSSISVSLSLSLFRSRSSRHPQTPQTERRLEHETRQG